MFLRNSYNVFAEFSPNVYLEISVGEKSSNTYTVPIGRRGQQISDHLILAK